MSNFSNKNWITKLQKNAKHEIQNKKIIPLELKMYPVEVKSAINRLIDKDNFDCDFFFK